ncbi:hypothetical protein SM139_0466, partial [Stenotrophomonas maltophilia]
RLAQARVRWRTGARAGTGCPGCTPAAGRRSQGPQQGSQQGPQGPSRRQSWQWQRAAAEGWRQPQGPRRAAQGRPQRQ